MAKPFRFGIAIAATEPAERFIETVKLAEKLGFDSIWVPDFRLFLDLYVALSLVALNTSRVRVGSAVTNPYTRHAAMTAVGIASVDELSGGRAALGIGAGGIVLRQLKIGRRRPVETCRRAIEEIRMLLGKQGARDGLRLDLPARPDLPVIIGATGRRMLALAGEIADGVIVNVGAHPACLRMALEAVERGRKRSGRPPQEVERLCWLQGTAVSDGQPDAARQLVKPAAALTLGRLPSWVLEAMEMDEGEIREIQTVYHSKGAESAAALVTDEMVERFTIAGTPRGAIARLKELQALDFDEFIFIVEEFGGNVPTAMRQLAEQVVAPLKE